MRPPTSKPAPTPSGGGSAAGNAAILRRDLQAAFDSAFGGRPHVLLAVSGGPDSMALMQLASCWKSGTGTHFSVVTIDHGLRPEAAAEAELVARECARLSWQHTTLRWMGEKPTTRVQEAARAARRGLIEKHLTETGISAVATAHTADDQAETMLMRLARGTGVDGLAAMRSVTSFGSGQVWLKPLLGVRKERLLAALPEWGCAWVNDPSNQSPVFERVRVRRARAALLAEGLDLDSKALSRTAARLARASEALQVATASAWAQRPPTTQLHETGWAEIDWDWLLSHPEEIRLRLLTGLLEAVGGWQPLSLGQLEQATIGRRWLPLQGTLNGVRMSRRKRRRSDVVILAPELDTRKSELPDWPLSRAYRGLWDGRFAVSLQSAPLEGFKLATLGRDAAHALHAHWLPMSPSVHMAALYRLPAVWAGEHLACVPSLGYIAEPFRTKGLENVQCTLLRPVFDGPAHQIRPIPEL